jgi:peptidyl-prolyl cis-trans isomerase B (cyclophilin B)
VTSNKRAKDLARAKSDRQADRRAGRAKRQRMINRIVAVVAVVVVAGGGVTWWALSSSGGSSDGGNSTPTPQPTQTTGGPTPSPTVQPDPNCTEAPAVRTDDMTFAKPGDAGIKPKTTYSLVLATNCGAVTIETYPDKAPQTVNSMLFLAQQSYFDLTKCHRLTTSGIFVLQCGDPKAVGSGGPGYTVPDENLPSAGTNNYPKGTVAMANSGPNTNGSQFFIVYADTTLPPGYTIWGKVTSGLDVIERIAQVGTETGMGDGAPLQTTVIETAKVKSAPAA